MHSPPDIAVASRVWGITPSTNSVWSNALGVALLSIVIGVASFLGDAVQGIPGSVFLTLTSSGLAWGLASLLAGFRQNARNSAIVASATVLLGATVTYYSFVLGVSQRWRGGHLDSGLSTGTESLLSIGRAVGFWLVASLVAGPMLGLLGWGLKTGSGRKSGMLAGLVFGLFSAQGFYTLFFFRAWMRFDAFGVGLLTSAVLTICISALATWYLVVSCRLVSRLKIVLLSAGASSVFGLALWELIEVARMVVSI